MLVNFILESSETYSDLVSSKFVATFIFCLKIFKRIIVFLFYCFCYLFIFTFAPLNPTVGRDLGSHRRLHPQAPNIFVLNPPSQLVIGYCWLMFLNQVRKIRFQKLKRKILLNEFKKKSDFFFHTFQNIVNLLEEKK